MWGKWRAVNTLWMHTYQEIKTPSGVWPSPGDWTFAGLFFLQGSFWCCGSACCTGWGSRVAALLWAAAAPDPPDNTCCRLMRRPSLAEMQQNHQSWSWLFCKYSVMLSAWHKEEKNDSSAVMKYPTDISTCLLDIYSYSCLAGWKDGF